MDYVRVFDVELDRPVYYAGETLSGHVYLEVSENMRLQNIKVLLRGKAHAEWKITRAGERRSMKQDEQYIDERLILWGKDESDSHQGIPIMTRGRHRLPFHFQLPDSALPCSLESKIGSIRYFVRVTLNIPYASCPQCIRYFTIVGPNIDCTDERYLSPVSSTAKRNSCSLCCGKGPLLLRATLDRTSFVCGEHISLKADVQNGSDGEVWVTCKIVQYVEFFINKGVLGLTKEVRHTVLEVHSDKVPAHDTSRLDELAGRLAVPVTPPTMVEVCGLVQIYYTLKLYLETSKGKGDGAEINFPLTIATIPYRTQNSPAPDIHYEVAASNTEGGMYISPEFQLGQVYMGEEVDPETDQTILYRPVYVCVSSDRTGSRADGNLLQVPSRQTARSRENVRGSREALQDHMTSSHQSKAEHAAMFQVEGSQPAVAKPEDKFLKEITAKIANRHVNALGDEGEGVPGLRDNKETEQDIHSQRGGVGKKKQPGADSVHQALVSELRRHLSEGEEGAAPVLHPVAAAAPADLSEKAPGKRPVKKLPPPTQQKPSSSNVVVSSHRSGSSPSSPGPPDVGNNKRLKTDAGDRESLLPAFVPDSSVAAQENEPLLSAEAPLVCSMEGKQPSLEKAETSEGEEELNFSEHSALLAGSGTAAVSSTVMSGDGGGGGGTENAVSTLDTQVHDEQPYGVTPAVPIRRSTSLEGHLETAMQLCSQELPPPPLEMQISRQANEENMVDHGPLAPFIKTGGDQGFVVGIAAGDDQQKSLSSSLLSKPSSSLDHEPPTVSFGGVPSNTQPPSVVAKPRHKDRHSFPASSDLHSRVHQDTAKVPEAVAGESAARPKSEMLQTSLERDSEI